MHRVVALTPKILLGILTLCIFYQLPWVEPDSVALQPSNQSETAWFQDARKSQEESVQTANSSIPPLDYSKIHISYGQTQCMPHFNTRLKKLATTRRESCTEHAPFDTQEDRRVALASITTGKPTEAYDRAILSQMFHAAVHETSAHILCEQLADGAWNKIAFLLNLVMNEMLKPAESRLEWILWIDRDAIVLDPCRPLSSFLPPNTSEFDSINLITNHDAIGLNAGLFFFKVNEWSIQLFNTILAFRYYRPDEDLILAEQTAMEKVLQEAQWQGQYVRVPWYWFNAYPAPDDSIEDFEAGNQPEDLEWFRARKGDFVVHFAGDEGRSERMLQWLNVVEEMDVWAAGDANTDVTREVQLYWESYREGTLARWQESGDPRELETMMSV